MNNLPMVSGENKLKLTKEEKVTSWLFWGGIIGTGVYFWGLILPFILTMLLHTWGVVILGGGLILLAATLMDKNIRRSGFLLWKLAMRKLAGIVVTIDPIALMKIAINEMKEERDRISEQIGKVQGQEASITKKIESNNKRIQEALSRGNKAQQMGGAYLSQASIEGMTAGRLKEFNDKLSKMLIDVKNTLSVLIKVEQAANHFINENTVRIQLDEEEFKMINSTRSALRVAMDLLNGKSNGAMTLLETQEYLREDMDKKIGEIRNAMRMSEEIIKGVDVENAVMNDKGLRMLQEFNSGKMTLLDINVPKQAQPVQINSSNSGTSYFQNLLD